MRKLATLAGLLLLSACTESEPEPTDYSTGSVSPNASSLEPVPDAKPASLVPAVPDHNYEERRGWDYLYVAAVSEEDRMKGRAAGDVITFQYLGLNDDGQHVLASMNPDGTVWRTASCSSKCRVIEYSDGRRIAYAPQSIIGAAFQDAFRGKLRVADWANDEIAQPMTPNLGQSMREVQPPATPSPAADEPWEQDEPGSDAPELPVE